MPQPQAYERQTDFTERDGDDTDHAALNQELDAAALSINEIRGNLALIQRDDGGLKNAVVTPDSLAPETFIALQGNVAGAVASAEAAALSALTSAITANTAKDATVLLAAATQTSQTAAALNAGTASAAAVTATAQAVISGDQAGLAAAQAGIATAGAATATAAAATATAQSVIATNQAGISSTQAGISIAKAGEASASAGAAATDRALAQAAAESITAQVAVAIHAAPTKTTLADNDEFGIADSATAFGLSKLTMAALRANMPNALSVYTAISGTANAIVLTTSPASVAQVSLQVGTQVRFRASAANTGATTINWGGTGVKSCRTITGVALPAGYIRTDVDTVATYDGTYFVVQREIERGSNANGLYVRWADGTQIATRTLMVLGTGWTPISPTGSYSPSVSGSFAASFNAPPIVSALGADGDVSGRSSHVTAMTISTSGITALYLASHLPAVSSFSIPVYVVATGRWYD